MREDYADVLYFGNLHFSFFFGQWAMKMPLRFTWPMTTLLKVEGSPLGRVLTDSGRNALLRLDVLPTVALQSTLFSKPTRNSAWVAT